MRDQRMIKVRVRESNNCLGKVGGETLDLPEQFVLDELTHKHCPFEPFDEDVIVTRDGAHVRIPSWRSQQAGVIEERKRDDYAAHAARVEKALNDAVRATAQGRKLGALQLVRAAEGDLGPMDPFAAIEDLQGKAQAGTDAQARIAELERQIAALQADAPKRRKGTVA